MIKVPRGKSRLSDADVKFVIPRFSVITVISYDDDDDGPPKNSLRLEHLCASTMLSTPITGV